MSARFAALGAFALALAVHAGLVLALVRPQEVKLEGAGQPQEASLGATFASLATPALPAENAEPTLQASKPRPLAAANPKATTAATALTPTAARPAVKPATVPAAPSAIAAEPEAKPKPVTQPSPKAKPRATAKPAKKPAPKPQAKPRIKPQTKPAPKPTKKGSASGRTTAKAKPGGTTKKPPRKKAGNAAASNYPGRVNRHIAKRGRPSVGVKGRAVIRFTISANGRLASAAVARSSGSATLDRAALQLVRRAAPFPRPPAGAQRSFSIGIKGR